MRAAEAADGIFAAIDAKSAVPLYLQIVAQVESALREGRLAPGVTIPTEPVLCARFDVSRKTLRRATDHLVSLGLIRRIHGVGTVVTDDAQVDGLSDMRSLHDKLISMRKTPETRLISQEKMVVDQEISSRTGFAVGEEVVLLKRLRLSDHAPLAVLENVVVSNVLPLKEEDISQSFLAALKRRGFNAHLIRRQIEAVAATPEIAVNLLIETGTPILRESQRASDVEGRIFNFATNYYHPENYLMANVEFAPRMEEQPVGGGQ